MAKATKVQNYDDGSDEEHDNENESDSDDDEPTKDELFDLLDDAKCRIVLLRQYPAT